MSDPEREDKDQLWSEATLWFARMRSPDAETFRPEFEAWLARGALHRRYYNRAGEYWVDSGSALRDSDEEEGTDFALDSRRDARRKHAVAALVASLVVIAGSTIVLVGRPHDTHPGGPTVATSPPTSLQFATGAGERRVRLADGSAILLGSDTSLRVQFSSAMRRLELDRGKARFDVAHEVRPFAVFAGGGVVIAHGTEFDVGLTSDHRVSVRLIRGSVEVRFPQAPKATLRPAPRQLRPGESVSFAVMFRQASGQAPIPPAPAAISDPLAGSQEYRGVRLADLVAEANRHAAPPIRFADPSIGEKKVSGRFGIVDNARLAERLAALFDLAQDRSNPSEIVLRPK